MRFPVIAALALLACTTATPKKPTVKVVEVSDQEMALCTGLAKNAVIACARGYIVSGGERKNEESPMYKYGQVACSEAGQAAFDDCIEGALDEKYLTSQANMCVDFTRFVADSVAKGCSKARDAFPGEKDLYRACSDDWATKGAAEHMDFCEQQKERVEL